MLLLTASKPMMLLLAVLAACASVVQAQCSTTHIYVDPAANPALGAQYNGSSAQHAFTNISDAEIHLKYLIAQGNTSTQVVVNLASGVYAMPTYLRLTADHSGSPNCPTIWQAPNGGAVMSGATKVSGWSTVSNMSGVYKVSVPPLSLTRALYVDGVSMPRARTVPLMQNHSTYLDIGWQYNGSEISLPKISKIQHVEHRAVGTFTDRYTPADYLSADGKTLVMKQPAWYRQIIGYDTADQTDLLGLFLENSLDFLDDEGEWYLDVEDSLLYYKPVGGKDPNNSDIYLPQLELVLSIGGYDYSRPAHDIQFINITFAHTTWNFPSSQYGFPDQQTGAFIGEKWNRSDFEESRPHWWMTPGSVQVSVAQNIAFQGGAVTCTGAAGLTVGNDDNAHISGVGLGAQNITISGLNFTQTGGNALQVGGIGLNAHHPIIPQMTNSHIVADHNYFNNNAFIFNSAANIFFTYTQYSAITSNTILNTPYSAICFGFGWGSNDPNGTPLYEELGLYNFQPVYYTPTTAHNNLINKNYIYHVGLNHTDLGGIYTLSMNNGTNITGNVISNGLKWGLYFDEGSRFYTATDNVVDAKTDWLFMNYQKGDLTGNQTVTDNWGSTQDHCCNGTDQYGDFIDRNSFFNASSGFPANASSIVNAAGATPGHVVT